MALESSEWEYRYYVADSLQAMPQNKYKVHSLKEILHPKEEDTRSGDDIAEDVMRKAGLTF
jgi:DNA-binding cell septation regulator SpoVG